MFEKVLKRSNGDRVRIDLRIVVLPLVAAPVMRVDVAVKPKRCHDWRHRGELSDYTLIHIHHESKAVLDWVSKEEVEAAVMEFWESAKPEPLSELPKLDL